MYCRYCGKKNLDDSIFCEHCGKRIREEKNSIRQMTSVTKLTEKAREIAEDLEKKASSVPEIHQKRKISFRITGKQMIALAVLLCVAVFVVILCRTNSLPAKNSEPVRFAPEKNGKMQTIYVADGQALIHPNSTNFISVYAYEFSEDGLPKVGYTINCEDYSSASAVYYAFDYNSVVREYAELGILPSELRSEEQNERYSQLQNELMYILAEHKIDVETMKPRIIGMEDSRVAVAFENGFFDFTEYNNQGKKENRKIYYMDKLTSQYIYTYDSDGKLKLVEVEQMNDLVMRNEYTYGSIEKPIQIKTTFFQNGIETSDQVTKLMYDTNGMQLSSYTMATGSTNAQYHYQKIQIPAGSVSELCSIYDHIGIKYFLGEEDAFVPDNLTTSELSQELSKAGFPH